MVGAGPVAPSPGRKAEMKRTVMGCAPAVVALALVVGRPAEAQDLQQKVAQ